MKKQTSIFVIIYLFFSFSTFALDDLSDKKIFCFVKIEDNGAKALAIHFTSNNSALIYYEKNKKTTSKVISKI